jgi:hypothetical protein
VPPPTVADRVRQALGIDVADFSGSSLAGEIPFTDAWVNRVVADRLAASQGPVAAAEIHAHQAQQLTALLSMRGPRLIPSVKVAAVIEEQPQFPHQTTLGLRWSLPGMGPLALLAAPALSYFRALPRGVRVDGDRVTLDIGELLRERGLGDLIGYVTALRVTTRSGAVLVQFQLHVP